MSKKKDRRDKKYNPAKSYAIAMEQKEKDRRLSLSKFAVVFVSGSVMAELYNFQTGKYEGSTSDDDYSLRHDAFKWSIYQSAFCVDQNGKPYSKFLQKKSVSLFTRDELAEDARESLDALVAGSNQLHLRGYGWIACPSGRTFTEEEAEAIFSTLNPYRERTPEELADDDNDVEADLANIIRDQEYRMRHQL